MASKWIGKRTQALSEAVKKSSKRTEFDDDFTELMEQTESTRNAVEKIIKVTPNFLHPNPAARAKLSVGSTVSKMRKTAAEKRYPHAVSEMSEALLKSSEELPPTSTFGTALRQTGDCLQSIADAQHDFDAEVTQNLIDPMKHLIQQDFKDMQKIKKKLEGRRLDYDYKLRKREQGKASITETDIRVAEQKLEESKSNMMNAMANIIDNDVEQVGQLASFVNAYVSFMRNSLSSLEELAESLDDLMTNAPTERRTRRPVSTFVQDDDDDDYDEDSPARNMESVTESSGPQAKALFDFEAENEGELSFREGDLIDVLGELDENWLEGEVRGEAGIFPKSYVELLD